MTERTGFISGATLRLIIALAIVAGGLGALYAMWKMPKPGNAEKSLRALGLAQPVQNRLHERFADANGDLVADTPADPSERVDPDVLRFSYIASESGDEHYMEVWQEFTEHLARVTGKVVEYVPFKDPKDQLRELKEGRLHLAGLNTGNVPIAVNDCGFVPFCTPAGTEGMAGYTMQILVAADSALRDITDLRGHTLTLTHPNSNSGFKAPLVILMHDFGMQVERDFLVRMSRSQDASIKDVASGAHEAAAVASDMVQRAVARGDIDPGRVRVLYESERFPTAGIGHVHTLEPALAAKVEEAFQTFSWEGTELERELTPAAAGQFARIDYKNDWALIRRIDDAIGFRHEVP